MGKFIVPCLSRAWTELHFVDVHPFLHCSQLFLALIIFVCSCASKTRTTRSLDRRRARLIVRQLADHGILLFFGTFEDYLVLDCCRRKLERKNPPCHRHVYPLFCRNARSDILAIALL